MAKVNGRLPNQVDKLVSNPTMRWIFTQMSGISLEHRAGKDYAEIVGLRNIHRDILQYFGDKVKAYYGL